MNILILVGGIEGEIRYGDALFAEKLSQWLQTWEQERADCEIRKFSPVNYYLEGKNICQYEDYRDLEKQIMKMEDNSIDLVIQAAQFDDFHGDYAYASADLILQQIFRQIASDHVSMDNCTMEELVESARKVFQKVEPWKTSPEDPALIGENVLAYTRALPGVYDLLRKKFPSAKICGICIDAYEDKDETDITQSLSEFSSCYNLEAAMFIHSLDNVFWLSKDGPLESIGGCLNVMKKLTSLL